MIQKSKMSLYLIIGVIFIFSPMSLYAKEITTEVSDVLKRDFKNNYGYPWGDASEIVQIKFFRLHNARVKRQQRIDLTRKIRKKQLSRKSELIRIMKKRKYAALKLRREKLRTRDKLIKRKNKRKFSLKMRNEMKKLRELRKKSKQKR